MVSVHDRHRVGRACGITALVLAAIFIVSIFAGPGNVLHSDPDSRTALAAAAQQGAGFKMLGFLDGLISSLLGILIVLLIALAGEDAVFSRLAYVSVAAAAGIQWTHAGMLYALSELGHLGGADAGVLALFKLGSTMDDADGIVIPIAMVCAAVLLLRSRRAPVALAWLTFVVAGIGAALTVLAVAGGPDLGPVTVIVSWVWLLAVGITFVVRPAWGEPAAANAARVGGQAPV